MNLLNLTLFAGGYPSKLLIRVGFSTDFTDGVVLDELQVVFGSDVTSYSTGINSALTGAGSSWLDCCLHFRFKSLFFIVVGGFRSATLSGVGLI
jgi:hypothetical protein